MEGDSQVVEASKDPKSFKIQFSRLNYIQLFGAAHPPSKRLFIQLSQPRWKSGVSALMVI